MSHKSDSLRQKLADIHEETKVIMSDVERTDRALTPIEQADLARLAAQFDDIEAQVQAADLDERATRALPSKTAPTPVGNWSGSRLGPVSSWGTDKSGFTSLGQFLGAVKNAVQGMPDPRLLNAVTTYGGEAAGTDGGFAVPPQFARMIWDIVGGEKSILGQLSPIPCDSNMLTVPVDETTPHGASGVTAEWYAEGATITATKPVIQQRNVTLYKAGALVHVSDELLEDSPQMGAHVVKLIGRKIGSIVESALVAGDGVGKPLGILSGPGTVTVDNSTTTLAAADLLNMVSRLAPGTFGRAFWLVHSSVLPYVGALTIGQVPVVQPDFTVSPYGKILGRPIFVSEYCQSWNAAAGDINLVSPDGLLTVVKAGGVHMASTIGFAFDQGLQSFRATVRIGQTPVLSAPIARKNGTLTQSHVVKLDVRS